MRSDNVRYLSSRYCDDVLFVGKEFATQRPLHFVNKIAVTRTIRSGTSLRRSHIFKPVSTQMEKSGARNSRSKMYAECASSFTTILIIRNKINLFSNTFRLPLQNENPKIQNAKHLRSSNCPNVEQARRDRVHRICQHILENATAPSERRGGDRRTALYKARKEAVMNHIRSFKQIERRHSRGRNSERIHLIRDLSVRKTWVRCSIGRHLFYLLVVEAQDWPRKISHEKDDLQQQLTYHELRAGKTLERIILWFPVVDHSFIPPDRVFENMDRKLRKLTIVMNPPTLYTEIMNQFFTLVYLGDDCTVHDCKTYADSVLKNPGIWHFQFQKSKNERQNFNEGLPDVIPKGIVVKEDKIKEVKRHLDSHYGDKWDKSDTLGFFTNSHRINLRTDDVGLPIFCAKKKNHSSPAIVVHKAVIDYSNSYVVVSCHSTSSASAAAEKPGFKHRALTNTEAKPPVHTENSSGTSTAECLLDSTKHLSRCASVCSSTLSLKPADWMILMWTQPGTMNVEAGRMFSPGDGLVCTIRARTRHTKGARVFNLRLGATRHVPLPQRWRPVFLETASSYFRARGDKADTATPIKRVIAATFGALNCGAMFSPRLANSPSANSSHFSKRTSEFTP
ncbi:hypothetical protein PR048_028676 [Dryococelus australis]|uniref:Uncharacterized protein n=1 Tax=Dryococelus australis TaxID=614101 RepID=A0ABQ9GE15_9NEOP|nr:hypothetical protein PR048_028676 [Dryococelus australis]